MSAPSSSRSSLSHKPPWLIVDLPEPHRVLSWSLNRPGIVDTCRLLWREVRNADLPVDVDVDRWLSDALQASGLVDGGESAPPVLITSRPLQHVVVERAVVDDIEAEAIATVGLSNAERVGADRSSASHPLSTINLAVIVSSRLAEAGLIEAMSIAIAARTAAVMEHGPFLPSGQATGTGTDCVAVAARVGDERFAGLHTALGEAIGRASYKAVAKGVVDWMRDGPHMDAKR